MYTVKLFKDNIPKSNKIKQYLTGERNRENVWICDNIDEVAGVLEMGSQNGFNTFIVITSRK